MPEWAPPAGGLQALTFDLDYILWDLEGVLHRAEQRQYDYIAEHHPRITQRYSLEDFHRLRLETCRQRREISHNVTELRKATLRRLALECGYDEAIVEPAFQVFLDARHEVSLFDDALPLLRWLKGRYVLGVITNGNAEIRRIGAVAEVFDFAVSPMEIGAAKPDRVIFEAACHRAGAEPGRVMHVGDEPESDVVGAAGYGMLPVWINRRGQPWPGELSRPDCIELPSLGALQGLLADWDGQT